MDPQAHLHQLQLISSGPWSDVAWGGRGRSRPVTACTGTTSLVQLREALLPWVLELQLALLCCTCCRHSCHGCAGAADPAAPHDANIDDALLRDTNRVYWIAPSHLLATGALPKSASRHQISWNWNFMRLRTALLFQRIVSLILSSMVFTAEKQGVAPNASIRKQKQIYANKLKLKMRGFGNSPVSGTVWLIIFARYLQHSSFEGPRFFWDVNEQNQNYNFSWDSCVQCHLF